MSSIQSALAAIDSFIWGPPLLILLVGTGIYLTLRLGLLQVVRLPLALRLVFGRDQVRASRGCLQLRRALHRSLRHHRYRQHRRGGHRHQAGALAPCSGCGWQPCSAWPPSTPSACWRSNIVSRMPTVRWRAAPCTIWRRGSAPGRWPRCSPCSASASPSSASAPSRR